MITPVVMPQMGLEVTEGTVAAIHVEVGAQVSEGDPLIEMETDKALTDVVSPRDGFVRGIEATVGDTVEIGAALVILAETVEESAVPAAAEGSAVTSGRTADGRVRVAPVARRAAGVHGIDLERVDGTGPRGRITLRDIERLVAANGHGSAAQDPPAAQAAVAPVSQPPPAPASEPVEPPTSQPEPQQPGVRREPMSAMRAAIARRMTLSQQIPQFTLVREIDASWLLGQKEHVGVGVNDLLLQAMAEVVLRHPDLAASYVEAQDGGRPALLHREGVDVGLAVATSRGLLVPVVRSVHDRSLAQIAGERKRLVGAARSGRLGLDDMGGAALTLSNLSSFGVDRFTAMINPGEAAILAVGRVVERVVPLGRGVAVIPALSLSLTIDHRVADGATGAAALVELAELLEGGMTWRP